jgi:hypothetical protein
MMKKINKKNKLIGAALVIAAIAFAGTASTADLTIGTGVGTLGYKAQTVAGGTVVAIRYTLSAANPALITHVLVDIKDPNLNIGDGLVVPVAQITLGVFGPLYGTPLLCAAGSHSGGAAATAVNGIITVAAAADSSYISDCTTVASTTTQAVADDINAQTLTSINITVQNV